MEQLMTFTTPTGVTEIDLYKIISEKEIYAPDKSRPTFKVITYNGCKKLADYFGVVIKETPLFLTQPTADNKNQHVRGMWLGFKGDKDRDNRHFCEGEASQFNTNIITMDATGKPQLNSKNIDAQFKSAMAFKRAYCRGVLRIIGLIGMYSSVESPSFSHNSDSMIADYDLI